MNGKKRGKSNKKMSLYSVSKEASMQVSEQFKINFEREFRNFLMDPKRSELELPVTLTTIERAYIHAIAKNYGVTSKSVGKNMSRKLCLTKKCEDYLSKPIDLSLSDEISNTLTALKKGNPVCPNDREFKDSSRKNALRRDQRRANFNLKFLECNKRIPISSYNEKLIGFRTSLPIWNRRNDIMRNILFNQVSLVVGNTGSGKSTQVPQFILDYSRSVQESCKIIVCEPRRISAVGLAERVADERNERIGNTVGYQIFLESRVSPVTNLIYCTNGIFLRWLMWDNSSCLSTITHIVIDEVHERDQFTDFLLIVLKQKLSVYPKLRLIVMSATMNVQLLSDYFEQAPIIDIPGNLYDVEEYYLEDILNLCNYMTPAMRNYLSDSSDSDDLSNGMNESSKVSSPQTEFKVAEGLRAEINQCIDLCFDNGGDEYFFEMLQFIAADDVSVDYQHQPRFLTVLMAAAHHGKINMVEELLSFGAKLTCVSREGLTALDYAVQNRKTDCANFINGYKEMFDDAGKSTENKLTNADTSSLPSVLPASTNLQKILNAYQKSIDNDQIDVNLIVELVNRIHISNQNDAILIFLPGYDEIVAVRNRLMTDCRLNVKPFEIFTLHSQMKISDQKRVFQNLNNKRKIILSTNISETSITINDVIYVIDCGKVKQKFYDVFSNVTALRTVWISQACAKQRKGRAGRVKNGVCFRLFSKLRYENLEPFTLPEILRTPLHVLCLHAKKIADSRTSINEYLSKAIDPPPSLSIEKAIDSLKILGALNEHEELTDLGNHLIDFPVEPHLAKILIVSTILKCLDPVLTIVSFLALKDPFLLPTNSDMKKIANEAKVRFASATFSDHMVFLKLFQQWQDACLMNVEQSFCETNFVNSSTMEMIVGIRNLLLSQLRQSGFLNHKPPHDIRYLNTNSDSWAIVKATLTTGIYPNLAFFNREKLKFRTNNEKNITIHLSSTLRSIRSVKRSDCNSSNVLPTDWVLFESLTRTNSTNCQIQCCTAVSDLIVSIFCGNSFKVTDVEDSPNHSLLEIDKSLAFSLLKYDAGLLSYVRTKWNLLVSKRLLKLNKFYDQKEDYFIDTLNNILLTREKESGLVQPVGIGQRPKQTFANSYSTNIVCQQPLVQFDDVAVRTSRSGYYENALDYPIPEVLMFDKITELKPDINFGLRNLSLNSTEQSYSSTDCSGVSNSCSLRKNQNNFWFGKDITTYCQNNEKLSNVIDYDFIWKSNDKYCAAELDADCLIFRRNDYGANSIPIPNKCDSFQDNGSPDNLYSKENWTHEYQQKTYSKNSNEYYVLVKANNVKSIDLSLIRKTWTFSWLTESKINTYLAQNASIYLIFFVANSPYLCGLAELLGSIDIQAKSSSSYSLGWISRASLPIPEIKQIILKNYSVDVDFELDGNVVDVRVGRFLYQLFTDCTPERPSITEPISIPTNSRPLLGGGGTGISTCAPYDH